MQQIAPKEYDYKEFQNIAKDKGPDEENKDPNEENPEDIIKELMSSEKFHEQFVQIAQKAFRNGLESASRHASELESEEVGRIVEAVKQELETELKRKFPELRPASGN